MSFLIGISIFLSHIVIAGHAGAFRGNDTVGNSGQVPELRSLRPPVVFEEPPNCLPPAEDFHGENHCWYIMQDRTQVHAGTLIRGNAPGTLGGGYVTIGVSALHSNPRARDVAVWAEGDAAFVLELDFGIKVHLFLNVPRFGKSGGVDAGDEKQLYFPASLYSIVEVPCWGRVAATAEAFVKATAPKTTIQNTRLEMALDAEGERGYQRSRIIFFVNIDSDQEGIRRFRGNVGVEISASDPESQRLGYESLRLVIATVGHTPLYDGGGHDITLSPFTLNVFACY